MAEVGLRHETAVWCRCCGLNSILVGTDIQFWPHFNFSFPQFHWLGGLINPWISYQQSDTLSPWAELKTTRGKYVLRMAHQVYVYNRCTIMSRQKRISCVMAYDTCYNFQSNIVYILGGRAIGAIMLFKSKMKECVRMSEWNSHAHWLSKGRVLWRSQWDAILSFIGLM